MGIGEIIELLREVSKRLPISFFDVIFLVTCILYVWEEALFGLITAFFHLFAIVCAFLVGLLLYPYLSSWLPQLISITPGFSDAISFIVLAGLTYGILTIIKVYLGNKTLPTFPPLVERLGGAFFGVISYCIIALFFVALILTFPISGVIKKQIQNSKSGNFLLVRSHVVESSVRRVFGGAIEETLSFITIKPDSNETVRLRFHTTNYTLDVVSEKEMFDAVNKERAKQNQQPLTHAQNLQKVARAHAADMLVRGYFSHHTPEGLTPFDRLEHADISYIFAAENLAFAPDVKIAMDGLMKSPGHRANILESRAGQIVIGFLDAGIY